MCYTHFCIQCIALSRVLDEMKQSDSHLDEGPLEEGNLKFWSNEQHMIINCYFHVIKLGCFSFENQSECSVHGEWTQVGLADALLLREIVC